MRLGFGGRKDKETKQQLQERLMASMNGQRSLNQPTQMGASATTVDTVATSEPGKDAEYTVEQVTDGGAAVVAPRLGRTKLLEMVPVLTQIVASVVWWKIFAAQGVFSQMTNGSAIAANLSSATSLMNDKNIISYFMSKSNGSLAIALAGYSMILQGLLFPFRLMLRKDMPSIGGIIQKHNKL